MFSEGKEKQHRTVMGWQKALKRLTNLEKKNISYKNDLELRVKILIQRWLQIKEKLQFFNK